MNASMMMRTHSPVVGLSQQPGITTTAQLGYYSSGKWSPNAPVLLLTVKSGFNGLVFVALSKDHDGSMWVHPYTKLADEAVHSEGYNGDLGKYYCPTSLSFSPKTGNRTFTPEENELILQALNHWSREVLLLEPREMFEGDVQLDRNA